ncbi:hypothetical protein EV360DRAFT_48390 [Lentinula raphanica]|nr:hypothetical protein EV360DRAFT_48390 [Lentinula raphanica]
MIGLRTSQRRIELPKISSFAASIQQTTNDTKDSLRSLASDAISLVYAVMTTCDEVLSRRHKDSTQREAFKTSFHRTLQDIKNFALHVASRNVVLRFLTARSDSGKVAEFQNKMKMALDLFTVR